MLAVVPIAALLLVQPEAPLRGPRLSPRADRPTLVQRDLNSQLRPLETTPEEAALALLSLDARARAAADALLATRAAAIDRFVAGNLLLLGQLDTAGKAGRKLDQALLAAELYQKFRPVLEAGPLAERVAAVLPPEHAARFRGLLDEYWRAAVSQAVSSNRAAGKRDARWALHLGERLRHLGEEIGRSYERQAAGGTLILDYLLADLDLSPTQRETMTRLKLDFLERTGFRPNERQQQLFIAGALGYLTQAQRERALHKIANR